MSSHLRVLVGQLEDLTLKDVETRLANWLIKRCPNPHNEDCEIEVRQVFEAQDFGAEFTPELREQEEHVRAQVAAKK